MTETKDGGPASCSRAAGDLITKIANDAGLLDRRVWCRTCGATQVVHNGLRDGWPTCCSSTMTLDPPEDDRPTPKQSEAADG
jgi:hypothetical protein